MRERLESVRLSRSRDPAIPGVVALLIGILVVQGGEACEECSLEVILWFLVGHGGSVRPCANDARESYHISVPNRMYKPHVQTACTKGRGGGAGSRSSLELSNENTLMKGF